jgi:hypothetical protein
MQEPCTQTYTYQKHENDIIINNSIRKQRKKKNYSNSGLNMILLLMRKNYIAHKFNKHSIGFLWFVMYTQMFLSWKHVNDMIINYLMDVPYSYYKSINLLSSEKQL